MKLPLIILTLFIITYIMASFGEKKIYGRADLIMRCLAVCNLVTIGILFSIAVAASVGRP